MRAMNCSKGIAPKSLPERSRDRDLTDLGLAFAYHQHVGDFLELRVADLLLHPLIGGVDIHPETGGAVHHWRGE